MWHQLRAVPCHPNHLQVSLQSARQRDHARGLDRRSVLQLLVQRREPRGILQIQSSRCTATAQAKADLQPAPHRLGQHHSSPARAGPGQQHRRTARSFLGLPVAQGQRVAWQRAAGKGATPFARTTKKPAANQRRAGRSRGAFSPGKSARHTRRAISGTVQGARGGLQLQALGLRTPSPPWSSTDPGTHQKAREAVARLISALVHRASRLIQHSSGSGWGWDQAQNSTAPKAYVTLQQSSGRSGKATRSYTRCAHTHSD